MQQTSDSVRIRHLYVYFKVKKLSTTSTLSAICDAAFVDRQHTTLLLVCLRFATQDAQLVFFLWSL